MNTNAAVVVALLVLAGGVVGMTSQAQPTGTTTQRDVDGGTFDDVSTFMQRGVVATNGSVDAGMWLAAFETANNLTRKQALVQHRAATLDERLDRLEARIDRFPPENATSLALRSQRVRLVAEREALRNAVSEAETTAASEGVNATTFDDLDSRIENLTVPALDSNASAASTNTTNANATAPNGSAATTDEGRFAGTARRSGTTYSGP
ncbi:transposase [Halococcus hamelinensis]|uniref:transposase n=1 Tax=Halococcus hamelinensis TaxID=332168 RepID=UPI000A50365F|nr:transposase [Halococcus hamelinensis]